MNRRLFLCGLGMFACSAPARVLPKRRVVRKRVERREADSGQVCTGGASAMYDVQLHASPLAFHGEILVQSFGGELRVWDSRSMKRTHTWAVPHRHCCFVQDGTLVAFGWPSENDGISVIHRVSKGKLRSLPGPPLAPNNHVVVMPARHRDEIYVITDHIYRFTATGVPTVSAHPYPNGATREQWVSRGDGRLLGGRNGALYAVEPDENVKDVPIADRNLKHLVAATGERVWYSYAGFTEEDWNAHTLILAPATSPMEAEQSIDVAPCRIVHLASYRDTVAALLMTMGATAAEMNWKLAVFDESGKQRWCADVAESIDNGVALNNGFVAIGQHRVIVAAPDGMLRSWDAATGQETTPR